jgi:hypothetical protein
VVGVTVASLGFSNAIPFYLFRWVMATSASVILLSAFAIPFVEFWKGKALLAEQNQALLVGLGFGVSFIFVAFRIFLPSL